MNKEWSELNKTMQLQLRKKDTFNDGIKTLYELRNKIMEEIVSFKKSLTEEDLCAMPFPKAEGYHSKTVAYSLWHIFRIEDIVAHTLVSGDEQIFFSGKFRERTGSPIITTGNELEGQQIADFSKQLRSNELYSYISEVKASTETILRSLTFDMMKKRIPVERKDTLIDLNVVSRDEKAVWLIDYWCGKDIRGLIQMPFSRHWIMHIEACLRIINKLKK